MSTIIFGGTVSMALTATPSTGWVMGFDTDGILKQKNQFGIITEVGGGPTAGLSTTPNLQNVLSLGNDSGANSIIMGTSTFIKSNNGGGKIELDYGGTNSILISTDNSVGGESGIQLQNGFSAIYASGYKKAIELENGSNNISIYNLNSGGITLGVDGSFPSIYEEIDEIKISYNTNTTQSTSDFNKQSIFIGTRNSSISNGVVNTVVIGGQGLTASTSNSVYVPDLYIQKNKSIRSTETNQVFFLNDSNGDTYLDRSLGTFEKSWVYMTSEYSGIRELVELGVNSDPGYGTESVVLIYNSKGPSYSWNEYSFIRLEKDKLLLGAKDLDTTGDLFSISLSPENNEAKITGPLSTFKGLEYNDDYSGSYSVRSLVDKGYVDSQVTSATVPNLSTVLSTGNNSQAQNIIMGTGTYIESGNSVSGGRINLDFASANSVLISTDNAGLSTAYVLLDESDISLKSTEFYLQTNDGQIEVGDNQGLKYTTDQTDFQDRSLIDKQYVDNATQSIWSQLAISPVLSPTQSQTGYVVSYTGTGSLSSTSSMFLSSGKVKGSLTDTFSVGGSPQNLGFDTLRKNVYSTNTLTNNLTVLSNPSSQIIGTVSVGTEPWGIAYDPINDKIFVSNRIDNKISVINASNFLITATISVGNYPMGVEYADGKVYVANFVSDEISIIDSTTNVIVGTISTPTPRQFTYDLANEKLWYIGVGSDKVGIIDVNTNTIIGSMSVGSNPFDIKYDTNNEKIYVSNNGSDNVSVIDANSYLITATISVGINPTNIEFNNVDNLIYVSNFTLGNVSEIDASTLLITATFTTISNPNGLLYNENNNQLYILSTTTNKLELFQTQDVPSGWIGINKTDPSSELDVLGTITTTGFRLRNGGQLGYILTSDGSGRGFWTAPTNIQFSTGNGLTGSATSSIEVDFSIVASKTYVDTGTTSIWNAIDSISVGTITEVTAGSGLTGGGTFGVVTLDVSVGNGLEVISDQVYLGGTLSQNTIINLDGNWISFYRPEMEILMDPYSFSVFAADNLSPGTPTTYLSITGSIFNIQTSTGNVGETNELILSTYNQSINDGSIDNSIILKDNTNSKGIVYYDDYSANFTTYSLVTKGYVDSIAGVVTTDNGLQELSPGVIGLGGTLSQTTIIDTDTKSFEVSSQGLYGLLVATTSQFPTGAAALVYGPGGQNVNYVNAAEQGVFIRSTDSSTSNFTVTVNDVFTMSIGSSSITTTNLKGLVYADDYIGTFVTNSLVSKKYVDSVAGSVTTDNGLLQLSPGVVGLGGTLSQTTTIDTLGYDFTINSDSSEIELNRISTTYTGVTNTFKLEDKYAIIKAVSSDYNSILELSNENNGQALANIKIDLATYSNIIGARHNRIFTAVSSIDGSGSASSVGLYNISQSLTSGDASTNNRMIIVDELSNKGLVYDNDYSSNFTNNSLVSKGYVDSVISSSITTDNGLVALSPGLIGLGGTLSQNTQINGSGYDFNLLGLNNFGATFSGYSELKWTNGIRDSKTRIQSNGIFTTYDYNNGTYSQVQVGSGVTLNHTNGIGVASLELIPQTIILDGSSDNSLVVTDTFASKGLVYYDDYTSNFTTYSLVTKGYVDSVASSIGLTNGLSEISSGIIGLGGTISQNTTINGNGYTFSLSSFSKLRFTASQTNTQFSSLNLGDGFILSTSDGIQSNYLQSSNLSDISIASVDSSGTSSVVETGSSGPAMYIYDGASQSKIQIYTFDNTIGSGDGSSNNRMVITDEFASKGLVYYDDYSANFTTYSLVTKGYVDTQVSTATFKYSEIRSFTSGITETISHNLGTTEVIVQTYESSGNMFIPGTVKINGSNSVDITLLKTLSNIKIVIIG